MLQNEFLLKFVQIKVNSFLAHIHISMEELAAVCLLKMILFFKLKLKSISI